MAQSPSNSNPQRQGVGLQPGEHSRAGLLARLRARQENQSCKGLLELGMAQLAPKRLIHGGRSCCYSVSCLAGPPRPPFPLRSCPCPILCCREPGEHGAAETFSHSGIDSATVNAKCCCNCIIIPKLRTLPLPVPFPSLSGKVNDGGRQ